MQQLDCVTGGKELQLEGRLLITDHGEYVVVNVYAPNAGALHQLHARTFNFRKADLEHHALLRTGERPARPRLEFKMNWFEALREKLSSLVSQRKEVILVGDLNIPRSRQDVHPDIKWDGLYTPQACFPEACTIRRRPLCIWCCSFCCCETYPS